MRPIRSVLLVDDDPASNFLAQFLLKRTGTVTSIVTVTNGKEALEYVQEHCEKASCPDLILLDINMPLMNGFEFMEQFQLLKQHHEVEVVLLSSSVSPKDEQTASYFQIKRFINKPLTKEKVKKLLGT